jgi:hypothetical protein
MRTELKDKREYRNEWYVDERGQRILRAYAGDRFYDNKLGVGDGERGFRKIDVTLKWDDTREGWAMEFASFQPFIPKYADDWFSYRDLYREKDQEIRFRPIAQHVLGVQEGNRVVFEDAFGLGKDLVIEVTRHAFKKLVRIRNGYKTSVDAVFDFEFENDGERVSRETGALIETEEGDTYLQSFRMWDSGAVDGYLRGQLVEPCPVVFTGNILRKTIPGDFQQRARGDVYADVTVTYSEDKDTYYGTVFTTGGAPDSAQLNIGGWGDFYYSYLEFDLASAIAQFDTITSAVLGLKVNSVAVNDSTTFIRRITASWTEAGVNSSSNPASTTTDQVQMSNPVTTGAGNVDEKDVTAIVQSWIDGTNSNFGFKLHSTTNNNAAHSLHSSDTANPADEPYLEITFPSVVIQKTLRYVLVGQNLTFDIDLRDPGDLFDIRFFDVEQTNVTKSLRYAVIKEHAITKSLKYAVVSPVSVQKSLKYAVLTTPSALQKSLKYTVIREVPITKSLKYTVLTDAAIQKSLKYAVITSTAIQKSLTYELDTTNSQVIQRTLKYTVITEHGITKSLRYAVVTEHGITKSLRYAVVAPVAVTKSLAYKVIAPKTVQKSLTYRVIGQTPVVQKTLKYTVVTERSVTKSLKYTVVAPATPIQKSLKYTVLTTPAAITKSLRYAIGIEHAIQKTLKYTVVSPVEIEKTLKYTVITSVAITKSLTYDVVNITTVSIQKSLKYTVVSTPAAIEKSLRYAVVAPVAVTKSLKYTVVAPAAVTKSLKYTVTSQQAVELSLRYAVVTEHSITKSLRYVVVPPGFGGSLGTYEERTNVGTGGIIHGKKADTNVQVGVSRLK